MLKTIEQIGNCVDKLIKTVNKENANEGEAVKALEINAGK